MSCVVAKKKKAKVAVLHRIARALPAKPKAADRLQATPPAVKKPISLYYPKPDDMAGKVRMEPPKIPPHAEPLDIPPSREMKTTGRKKPLPYVATAVVASAVLSGALAAFFYYAIGLDWLLSALLALTFFIGLTILFYEFLELAERTK